MHLLNPIFYLLHHYYTIFIEPWHDNGCITVEMETAAFFAVAEFHQLQLAQLLYAGDDVSGEKWDERAWNQQKNVRANLIELATRIIQSL